MRRVENKNKKFRKIKRYDESLEVYKKAVRLNLICGSVPLKIGMLLTECGRYEEAEFYYKKAIELKPQNINNYKQYAKLKIEVEKYEESKILINKCMELKEYRAIIKIEKRQLNVRGY